MLALFLALVTSCSLTPAAIAQTVIDYPNGFAASVGQISLVDATTLSGSAIQLTQSGVTGSNNNAWYETPVNVKAFTTTFTFAETCPADCGDGLGFMIISVSNPSSRGYNYDGDSGPQFSWSQCGGGGTGCSPINSILVKFDLYDVETSSPGANLTGFYSGGTYPQPPVSTQYDMSPSGINMESGNLMRVTLTYNGTVLTEIVTDTVTGAVFTNNYTVNIPSLVGGNTAYVGFGAGTQFDSVTQNLTSWTYTEQLPGQAAVPMFSPVQGTYAGSQRITLSSPSAGAITCYNTTGSPATNGATSCTAGTLYTGPVTVSSSETLYAVAGGTGYNDSPVMSSNYVIQNSVAAPTFLPAAGTYASTQTVTISDITSNGTIYYTSKGTAPTASSSRYTGPITVNSTETLKAIAIAPGNIDSAVTSVAYNISAPTSVAPPAFSPPAGTYTSAQSVNITDVTSGVAIYYTTNGNTPTTSSAMYTGPITVNTTETLEAIAVAAGNIDSLVASSAYTINLEPYVATPTFSPAAGTYTSAQLVAISDATSGATIYYTTDGSTPSTSSTIYTAPIAISATETLKAIATAGGDNNSALGYAAYNITPEATVATPNFLPVAGAYASTQTVTISDATSGATIYYTTNGTAPTTSSTPYTGPITVSSTETLDAIAVATGDINSAVASAAYTISSSPVAATPVFAPGGGTYTSAQTVSISDATSGATIYYTTGGSTPTTSSTMYTGPITVSSAQTLEAIAVVSGYMNSGVAVAAYNIALQATVATPTFSPIAGAYTSAQSVTITDSTNGATIYYTTDGTMPTTSSTMFTGPIMVASTETLQAIATATGDINSAVASAAYTITSSMPVVATPAFLPVAGTYSSAQSASISDATPGAIIYYTTDGTMPTTSSSMYTGPIVVSSTETLEAIAVATGDSNSAVASVAYTITAQPDFMLAASPAALTVDSGGQGTVVLSVTPQNGFASAVSFSCSGLPAAAKCTFAPATVTPSGAAATTQLTITAATQSSVLQPESRRFFPFTTLAVTVCLFGWRGRKTRHHWLVAAVAYAGLGLLSGCGGASSGGSAASTTPNTTVTTSTVTVTATSGALQQTATVTLTVN